MRGYLGVRVLWDLSLLLQRSLFVWTQIKVQLDKLFELTALGLVSAHSLASHLFNDLLHVVQLRLHLSLLMQQ